MISILVVEDEKPIANLIEMNLIREGYQCTLAYDGLAAADILENQNFDLVLLDIMLPKVNGYELLSYIKPLHIPVIFLTAKSALKDRVKGLNLGAEDYIVKPFEIMELLARIDVVLRRYNKTQNLLHFMDITLDTKLMEVKKDGIILDLTPKEYQILLLFMQNIGTILYHEQIYEAVWNKDYFDESRTVNLHIQRLRKKANLEDHLKTIYGLGYCLKE